jgi:hypothetical protein
MQLSHRRTVPSNIIRGPSSGEHTAAAELPHMNATTWGGASYSAAARLEALATASSCAIEGRFEVTEAATAAASQLNRVQNVRFCE